MARGVKGNELVQMHMLIPEKLMEWIREEAERTSRSKTDIVVMALERMKEGKG